MKVNQYLELSEDGKTLIRCDESAVGNIIIPNGVTKIGDKAFKECASLTSVEIPDSVTVIGEEAFSYCIGLTSLKISGSVTEIGKDAFEGCTSLNLSEILSILIRLEAPPICEFKTVKDSDSFLEIDEYFFKKLISDTSIKYPNNIPKTKGKPFEEKTKPTSEETPKGEPKTEKEESKENNLLSNALSIINNYKPKNNIFDLLYNRKEYSFYNNGYSILHDIALNREYIKKAMALYEFYDNHPNSGIKNPEYYGISPEDVIRYYYNLEYSKIQHLSKIIKYMTIIPDSICEYEYGDKIILWRKPVCTLLGGLSILIMLFVIINSFSYDGFFGGLVGIIFSPFALGQIFLGLLFGYWILQSFFVFIHNSYHYLRHNSYMNEENKIKKLRDLQIAYLIEHN